MKVFNSPLFVSVLFILVFTFSLFAQITSPIDLQQQYLSCKTDTGKVNLLLQMADGQTDFDSVFSISNRALHLSFKVNFKRGIATSFKKLGNTYMKTKEYDKAIDNFSKGIKYFDAAGDKGGTGKCLYNIGLIYYNQANYTRSLQYRLDALKIFVELKNQPLIARCYSDIGNINYVQYNYPKSLEYFEKALAICDTLKDEAGIAKNYNNIGLIYIDKKDFPRAFEYILKALKVYEKTEMKLEIGSCYSNIAVIYSHLKDFPLAIQYYKNAIKIKEEIGDDTGLAACYVNIGSLNENMKNYQEAIKYSSIGIEIAKKINDLDNIRLGYGVLANCYEDLGDYKNAFTFAIQFKSLTDSIYNIENAKQMSDLKTNFAVQQKESELKAKAKAEQDKQAAVADAEKKRQQTITYFFISILFIVLIASVFLWNRYKVTQRQKNIIEKQKDLVQKQKQKVEEKNKEILDSIQYAKRLQNAILPNNKLVKEFIADSFIFFRPKDIVAGDFYWLYPIKKSNGETIILIAAADCTGHGVPGAMVSVVCANALNRAVKEMGIQEPGKILDTVSNFVIETFVQNENARVLSEGEVSDGMDISLASINLTSGELLWAGANNSLIVVKNNSSEMVEIKPDKQPVGLYENSKPFTTHSMTLEKGSMMYLFSDGYADQFGGERGKKLMKANFNKFLLQIASMSSDQQLKEMENHFETWKGEQQQVDDICVIGVRM